MEGENKEKRMVREIVLKKGVYFGEIAILLNSVRTATIISKDFSICEVLS